MVTSDTLLRVGASSSSLAFPRDDSEYVVALLTAAAAGGSTCAAVEKERKLRWISLLLADNPVGRRGAVVAVVVRNLAACLKRSTLRDVMIAYYVFFSPGIFYLSAQLLIK
jgi:hypothetical protein